MKTEAFSWSVGKIFRSQRLVSENQQLCAYSYFHRWLRQPPWVMIQRNLAMVVKVQAVLTLQTVTVGYGYIATNRRRHFSLHLQGRNCKQTFPTPGTPAGVVCIPVVVVCIPVGLVFALSSLFLRVQNVHCMLYLLQSQNKWLPTGHRGAIIP